MKTLFRTLTICALTCCLINQAGNRLDVTEADNSSIQWTYDDAYRLLSETRRNSSNAITYQSAFTYDPVGNRSSQTVNSVTTSYTYNNLDQMLTAGAIQYQYDGRGNLTRVTNGSNITQYAYNATDKLASVTLPNTTNITYTYDASGRRVKQTVGSTVTNYLWDEASPYGDVVLETNGTGSILASYVLGGTELLSQTRSGVTRYYLHNGQGSTQILADNNGGVTDTYSYTAFGETLSHEGSTINAYQYTGQQSDSLTGLYSLRARYYDPAVGRFLSQDTYPYSVNDPVQLNRYAYAANNPTNAMDPLGLQAFVEYSVNEARTDAEGAAVEPMGEEFASEAEQIVDDELWEALSNNAGDLGDETSRIIRAENLASQLVEEGLNSPNSQTLIRELNQVATYNPDAQIVSLGRYPYYIEKATEEGYTYFNLPGNSSNILGNDLAQVVNEQWMYTQMEAEKDFGFTLGEFTGLGEGSQLEYDILGMSANYSESSSTVFDFIFNYIAK